jgi:hypothetical protein
MSIKNRLEKLENMAPKEAETPLRIAWFEPNQESILGYKDDDGVITMRLDGESFEELRNRAQDNSIWQVGMWHEYDSIY